MSGRVEAAACFSECRRYVIVGILQSVVPSCTYFYPYIHLSTLSYIFLRSRTSFYALIHLSTLLYIFLHSHTSFYALVYLSTLTYIFLPFYTSFYVPIHLSTLSYIFLRSLHIRYNIFLTVYAEQCVNYNRLTFRGTYGGHLYILRAGDGTVYERLTIGSADIKSTAICCRGSVIYAGHHGQLVKYDFASKVTSVRWSVMDRGCDIMSRGCDIMSRGFDNTVDVSDIGRRWGACIMAIYQEDIVIDNRGLDNIEKIQSYIICGEMVLGDIRRMQLDNIRQWILVV